jgi:hypothetical protein
MNVTLLLAAVLLFLACALLVVRAVSGGFRGWSVSEKVAAAQILLPFGAAAFVLNALFGSTLERPSTITAAIFTLAAGVLAIIKQVASTIEAHPPRGVDGGAHDVSLRDVVHTLFRG